ncbi:hypothetical protein ABT001_25910 [Streptomyces sp. NPDC002793]|uniref:hypothetical protein n=1 Tax=Streptomyces sp. NPDC002793 TaxID=3154432 RepID=UPI00332241EB
MTPRRSAAHAATALLLALVAACGTGCGPGGAEAGQAAAPPSARPGPSGAPTGPPTPTTAPPPSSAPPASPATASTAPRPPVPATEITGPDLSRTDGSPRPPGRATPSGTAPTDDPARTTAPGAPATPEAARSRSTTLRIGEWSARVVRGGQEEVDACQDAVQWAGPSFGGENGYAMRTIVVVGHDHCGFQQFATLPVGTVVTVETPSETLRYRVYTQYLTPGRGALAHGLYWGDLTLQSCVGQDTGFTYLTRTA